MHNLHSIPSQACYCAASRSWLQAKHVTVWFNLISICIPIFGCNMFWYKRLICYTMIHHFISLFLRWFVSSQKEMKFKPALVVAFKALLACMIALQLQKDSQQSSAGGTSENDAWINYIGMNEWFMYVYVYIYIHLIHLCSINILNIDIWYCMYAAFVLLAFGGLGNNVHVYDGLELWVGSRESLCAKGACAVLLVDSGLRGSRSCLLGNCMSIDQTLRERG